MSISPGVRTLVALQAMSISLGSAEDSTSCYYRVKLDYGDAYQLDCPDEYQPLLVYEARSQR